MFTLSPTALAAELPFEDVTEDDVHYEAVDLLYRTGITAGVSETEFGPDRAVTRQQFATFVVRALGRSEQAAERAAESPGFADDADIADWARGSAAIASELEIVAGYPDGTFRPERPINHAEMFTMLTHTLGVAEAAEGQWPTNFMNLAEQVALDEDIADVQADNKATRAEMAVALSNTILSDVRGWDADTEQMIEGDSILQENFPAVYEEWIAEEKVLQLLFSDDRWEEIGTLAFAPDNDTLAVGAREVDLFSVSERTVTASGGDLDYGDRPESRSLSFAPDGSYLAAAWRGVSLHYPVDLSPIVQIHSGGECRVAISPDGSLLATHPNQITGEVWLWQAENEQDFTKVAEFVHDDSRVESRTGACS